MCVVESISELLHVTLMREKTKLRITIFGTGYGLLFYFAFINLAVVEAMVGTGTGQTEDSACSAL